MINRKAIGNSNIPVGMKSVGDWHVMFQQKDEMLMMWATQAPMEQLKQMVVKLGWEGDRGVRGIAGLPDVALPSVTRESCPQAKSGVHGGRLWSGIL